MGSEDDRDEVVPDAEASTGHPPAGEAPATSSRRRRRGSRRVPAVAAEGQGHSEAARPGAAAERTASGAGDDRRPGPQARRQQGPAPAASPGYRYAIRVQGLLDAHWSQWLEGMTITHEEGGVTRLEGALIDQSALHGLLNKLRDLRLTIVTLERLGAADIVAPSSQEPPESREPD
jgi:hypothetical protein